ncbi:MAG: hypothetical protein HQL94_11445, partial [Magnetococcales bacterium]|nr:hypothetical protein [Magnetococcales bacterium]
MSDSAFLPIQSATWKRDSMLVQGAKGAKPPVSDESPFSFRDFLPGMPSRSESNAQRAAALTETVYVPTRAPLTTDHESWTFTAPTVLPSRERPVGNGQ